MSLDSLLRVKSILADIFLSRLSSAVPLLVKQSGMTSCFFCVTITSEHDCKDEFIVSKQEKIKLGKEEYAKDKRMIITIRQLI